MMSLGFLPAYLATAMQEGIYPFGKALKWAVTTFNWPVLACGLLVHMRIQVKLRGLSARLRC